jgi:hypothetical protein
MLRYPKIAKGSLQVDESKPPTLTVKIPQWSGVWKSEIYDEDKQPLCVNGKTDSHLTPLDFLKPKTHVICLLECGGLWFVNGKISITWNLKQAMVQKPKQTIEGTCFLNPNSSDRQLMKTLPPPEEIDPEGAPTTIVEDSDDERDFEIELPPAPVVQEQPKPVEEPKQVEEQETVIEEVKPKKKIVRKAKTDA